MGFGLGICDDCGNIDYDFKFIYFDEDNKKVCENKELCKKFDNVINRRYIYYKYVMPNLRYICRRADTSKLFLTIDWMIDNIDEEDTELFEDAIKYIKSCSR
jgi:hypothetical protein